MQPKKLRKVEKPKRPPEVCRAEFVEKNAVLEAAFPPVYQDEFYRELFDSFGDDSVWVLVNGESPNVRNVLIEELDQFNEKNNVYVYPAGFDHWVNQKLMTKFYALVLDVDDVTPAALDGLLQNCSEGDIPTPTYITNSGSGVHFYYVLRKPLNVDGRNDRGRLRRFCSKLYSRFNKRFLEHYPLLQPHWMGQSYRLVGSLTKLGQRTTCWQSGESYSLEELAEWCGLDTEEYLKPPVKHATPKQLSYAKGIAKELGLEEPEGIETLAVCSNFISAHRESYVESRTAKAKKSKRRKLKGGAGNWYKLSVRQVMGYTEQGHRYNALCALAVIAVKSEVDEEEFEKDLKKISRNWQVLRPNWWDDPWTGEHDEAVMRYYRWAVNHGKNITSETLEEMLGFKFRRKVKKNENPRPQKRHLARARALQNVEDPEGNWRNKTGAPTKADQIRAYAAEHPEANHSQIARALGVSRPTVIKWLKND